MVVELRRRRETTCRELISEAFMTVHIVLREDQSEYGFVDTSVAGLFQSQPDAESFVESSIREARAAGQKVFGDPGDDADWEVSWVIEAHPLS
jgi:hypothetical protein